MFQGFPGGLIFLGPTPPYAVPPPPPPPPGLLYGFSGQMMLPVVPAAPKTEKALKKKSSHDSPVEKGINYMCPKNHTHLHVVKDRKLWEKPGTDFDLKIWKVGTGYSINDLVERLLDEDADGCKGWTLTEVTELGDGHFDKAMTIVYGSDKAKGTLASVGWNEKRGDSRPPVWVCLYKE